MSEFNEKDLRIALNKIFSQFFGLFPSCYSVFHSQEEVDHSKKAWCHAFIEANLMMENGWVDKEKINKGLKCLPYLNQQFMPSAGQFINLCLYGLGNENP